MKLVLLFGAALVGLSAVPPSAGTTVADHGVPRAVIVLADAANPFYRTAATDLQQHLQLATGARFEIAGAAAEKVALRLIVGDGPASRAVGVSAASLAPEEYRVVAKGNTIVFVGRDIAGKSNATAWAVDAFLDRQLGVRWLWPGDLGTYVPRRPRLEVPEFDFTDRPAFEQRRLRARAEGVVGDWLRRHQMGSRMQFGFGHAFTGWWKKYHETHPDYFAVPPAGQQQPYPQEDRVKLRVGNPAVADQIIAEWRAAGRPDNWNVCPNDGSGWDTSAESRALDLPDVFTPEDIWQNRANLSRRFVRFWNGLLVRMRQENPRVTLSTYAYSCYRIAPTDVKLEPGLVVGIVHTYADTEGWRQWDAAGAKLVLRPNWWHLGGSAPHVPLHAQGDYFRFAREHSMIGFDFDSLLGEWGNQGVLYYLIARMSVRADLSVDQIIDEYASAFGSAAPLVRGYIDYWETYTRQLASPVPAGGDVSQDRQGRFESRARELGVNTGTLASTWILLPYLYTDDIIAPAEAMLARARGALRSDEKEPRERVEYLATALVLLREHRAVLQLADKKRRKPGETDAMLAAQINRFETQRRQATERFGPIGFGAALPSRLKLTDPRRQEGL